MATSDSLLGFVPALSGITLIRFPTRRSRLCWTEQGLSGWVDALSLRSTALYTVPAARIHSRYLPVSVAGFASKGQARPGKNSS
jgi:hypothetical protein